VEPQALIRARDGDHDDVLEPDHLDADGGDAVTAREPIELRLRHLREAVPGERAARHGDEAGAEAISLGHGIERDQLLGDQHSQDVQARAGNQAERAGDRIDPPRLLAPAEQPQNRHRARHRRDLARRAARPAPRQRLHPDPRPTHRVALIQ